MANRTVSKMSWLGNAGNPVCRPGSRFTFPTMGQYERAVHRQLRKMMNKHGYTMTPHLNQQVRACFLNDRPVDYVVDWIKRYWTSN